MQVPLQSFITEDKFNVCLYVLAIALYVIIILQKVELYRALNAVTDFGEVVIQDYNKWNYFFATDDNGKVFYKFIPPDKQDYWEGINSILDSKLYSYVQIKYRSAILYLEYSVALVTCHQ